jgi:hypothetical protein
MNKLILLLALSLPLLAFFEEDEAQNVLQVPQKARPVTVSTVAPEKSSALVTLKVRAQVEGGVALSIAVRSEGEFVPAVSLNQFVQSGAVIGHVSDPMRTLKIQGLQTQLKLLDEQIALAKAQRKRTEAMLRMGIVSEDALIAASTALRQKELERTQLHNALSQQQLLRKGETVRSPEAGYITALAPSGSYLAYGAQAATLNPTHTLVRMYVPPLYAAHLKPGQKVELKSGFGETNATVTAVLPQSSADLIDVIAQPESALPVGTALEARIAMKNIEGWILPKSAIVLEQNRPALFVIENGVAKLHFVTVQKDMLDRVLVSDHLNPDDAVASQNAYMLHDGVHVEVAP